MEIKTFCNYLVSMYLYTDMLKWIHLSTKKHWIHNYCDQFQDDIRKFLDELSEQFFGYYGRPNFSDFSFEQKVEMEEDMAKIMVKLQDIVTVIQDDVKDNTHLSGIVSLIDDFKGKLGKMVYLSKFDDISSFELKK